MEKKARMAEIMTLTRQYEVNIANVFFWTRELGRPTLSRAVTWPYCHSPSFPLSLVRPLAVTSPFSSFSPPLPSRPPLHPSPLVHPRSLLRPRSLLPSRPLPFRSFLAVLASIPVLHSSRFLAHALTPRGSPQTYAALSFPPRADQCSCSSPFTRPRSRPPSLPFSCPSRLSWSSSLFSCPTHTRGAPWGLIHGPFSACARRTVNN